MRLLDFIFILFYPKMLISCATIRPPPVPTTYPSNAMIMPTGTNALLYVPASTGAVAVPPIFARDATAQVNISMCKSFARIIIIVTWNTRIIRPVISHIGALPILLKSARDAISAMTM